VLQPDGLPATLQAGRVHIEPISGAANSVAPTATAFPHRDGWLAYQFQARVRPGAPRETVDAGQEWVTDLFTRLTPWRTGWQYSNFGNRAFDDWARAYYGENLGRLRRVKAQVDPGNLFRFQQSIRPA
jgi:FAD/FMN-containing dehydrogenase